MQKKVQSLLEQCEWLTEDQAYGHCLKNGWNVAKAIDMIAEDQDYFQQGIEGGAESQSPDEPFLCEVCYEEYEAKDVVRNRICGHALCIYCYGDYI